MSVAASIPALVDALRERGVLAPDAPSFDADEESRPWFIAVLQGIAGWLAGVFLLAFVAMIVRPDSSLGLITCGGILLAGAWALYYAVRNSVFAEQLALGLSIAGQFAVAASLLKDSGSAGKAAAVLLALQLAVFALMPNKQARTLAAFFAGCAWIFLVRYLVSPARSDWFFLDAHQIFSPPMFGVLTPWVTWLITWAPVAFGAWWLLRAETRWMASNLRAFFRPALVGAILTLAFAGLATEPIGTILLGDGDLIGREFSLWSLFPLLSIGLAMYAADCAFRVRSRGLLGIAIFSMLANLGRFYYLYGTTLLAKSLIMLAVGVLLLLIAQMLKRRPEVA